MHSAGEQLALFQMQLKGSFYLTSTHFLAPDFLPGLQPALLILVRDPQPPNGRAGSQGMCPCYSPSKVCYGLVTGSPELRHLLACRFEIARLSQGKRQQEKKGRIDRDRVNIPC